MHYAICGPSMFREANLMVRQKRGTHRARALVNMHHRTDRWRFVTAMRDKLPDLLSRVLERPGRGSTPGLDPTLAGLANREAMRRPTDTVPSAARTSPGPNLLPGHILIASVNGMLAASGNPFIAGLGRDHTVTHLPRLRALATPPRVNRRWPAKTVCHSQDSNVATLSAAAPNATGATGR